VETAPDSPQRGFELALYYAVTHDQKRGREAILWALAHHCERRQEALVRVWSADLISEAERKSLDAPCVFAGTGNIDTIQLARDGLFEAVGKGERESQYAARAWRGIVDELRHGRLANADSLYAAIEFIDAVRTNEGIDLRQDDPTFFSKLPAEYLLSLEPAKVVHPDWMAHIAALAYVGLDPNLAGSQYLQSWAMQDSQMLRDGPGVAFEFLWGDPYLPGIGYEDLSPWIYDADRGLRARTDWSPNACWIEVARWGSPQVNCPRGWEQRAMAFGQLMLVPLKEVCVEAPRPKSDEAVIISGLRPQEALTFLEGKKIESATADAAGLWLVPQGVAGNVCAVNRHLATP